MVVLSLCDGMSCGYMALEKCGLKIDAYYASEIKPTAIKASSINFPSIIQIGDVTKVSYKDGVLHTEKGDYETSIDLVIFGSPCQSFSRAMNKDMRIGLADSMRSGIFYECNRILKEVNPRYFLMENVIMDAESENVINGMMGVSPININSSLLTGQMRNRLYWTNIPNVTVPADKGVTVQDIIDGGFVVGKKAKCLRANESHGFYNGCNFSAPNRFHRAINKSFETLVFDSKEAYEIALAKSKEILDGRKPRAEYYDGYSGDEFNCFRYLNKYERARLQTVPEKYVECLTEKEAADLCGDGWTVDVIAHIFKGLHE